MQGTKPRIMIVEDEFVVAEDIRECLEHLGYAISSTASSGEEALERIEQDAPDLILMDIVLTGEIDGIETARRIAGRHHIPIIFLTAHSEDTMVLRAKMIEPYGYILKPFDDRSLHVNLEIALHRAQTDRQLREDERKFREFVEGTDDLIIRIDRRGNPAYMNPAAMRILGPQSEERSRPTILEFLHPEDRGTMERILYTWMKGRKDDMSIENRIIDQDGTVRDMLWQMNWYSDDRGEVAGMNMIGRDITELKKGEDDLKEINTHLRESLAKIKRLSGCYSMCGHCKKIRDEKGQWRHVEEYIRTFSDADIIHTICLECLKKIYPDIYHKDVGGKKG